MSVEQVEIGDEEAAEMVARLRTPAGFDWKPLAADIINLFKAARNGERLSLSGVVGEVDSPHTLCKEASRIVK